MHASIAVFAERAATRTDGKLDIIGVYNCRFVQDFPVRLDITIVLRFEIEPLDYANGQHIEIHVLDEDSHDLVTLQAIPLLFDSPRSPGLPLAYDMVVPATIVFSGEGTYTFDVRVNERLAAQIPLRVQRAVDSL